MTSLKRVTNQEFTKEKEQLEKMQRTPKYFAEKMSKHSSSYKIAKSFYKLYNNLDGSFHILPNFLIIGAARAGSTSLYEGLIKHPNIFSSKIKEVYFFDINFRRGSNWYKRFFPSKWKKFQINKIQKKEFLTGEATPHYISYLHAPKRVFNLIPNVKLIVILRNPVERAYSQYQSRVAAGNEPLSFVDAIKEESNRLDDELKKMNENEDYIHNNFFRYSYLHHGIYVDGLKNWMNIFPKEQFLIINANEFYQNPKNVFLSAHKFLDIPRYDSNDYTHYNLGKYKEMDVKIKKELQDFFKPHNEELYKFLGRDFEWD